MSFELRAIYRARANGKLKNLEALGGVLGLVIRSLGRIKGVGTVPWGGERACLLQGYGHEVGAGDVVLDFLQGLGEIGLCHLLHRPFLWDLATEETFL